MSRFSPPGARPRLSLPSYDGGQLRSGVVHLGVGRFHRAHQARYFDEMAEQRVSHRWGVVGAGFRSVRTQLTLAAQDQLFTVVETGSERPTARVVGILQDCLFAPRERARLVRQLAHEDTRLVTLTVTADAYRVPLGQLGSPSAFEVLVEALDLRRRSGLAPFTVMSCDNVPDNGAAAETAVQAAAAGRPGLSAWIGRNVAFPSTMVDRIAVAPDDDAQRLLRRQFGIIDPCAVLTEPFAQWVVEDAFCNERPPLEDVGVEMVSDVRPYQRVKTRLLNASHCAVGYLGSLAGHTTSAQVAGDPVLRGFVEDLLTEVTPLLPGVPAWDLLDYRRTVVRRIANPGLADPLTRLTRRGSVRIPAYVQPSLVQAVAAGRDHRHLALVVAAWVVHLRDTPLDRLDDPAAAELAALARAGELGPLLRHGFVCGPAATSTALLAEVTAAVDSLDRLGVRATVGALAQATRAPARDAEAGRRARARLGAVTDERPSVRAS